MSLLERLKLFVTPGKTPIKARKEISGKSKKTVKKKTRKKITKKITKKTLKKTKPKAQTKKKPEKPRKKPLKKSSLKKLNRPLKKLPRKKEIGVVTHYFGKISVGIIKLKSALRIGDKVQIKGAHDDFTQLIKSIQVNHKDITHAKKGNEIGIKVTQAVHGNDKVYKLL